ncbi:hypothetical protein [Stenotrophomonas rhizophila]|uniref:hypothetical protein n=1 Tax=Stenotrophomonas rhizophila TaxID=216778 RepID=UPI0028D42A07|nr:hypothetical protein [Stenotrophomonas rhizophila]
MSDSGSRITAEEYSLKHPHLQLTLLEKNALEEGSTRLFMLGNKLIALTRPQLPDSLKESIVLQFTNYETPQAKAGGFAPDLNIISISMGLIGRILAISKALSLEKSTIQSIEGAMLILVVGHELTHVMFGHNEVMDEESMEASAMEVHSDYFAGLYLARLIHPHGGNVALEQTAAIVAILAGVLLFSELGGERTETYHSAPVRLAVVLAGYLRWTMDHSPAAAMQIQATLDLRNLNPLIDDAIQEAVLADKVRHCISCATSADESLSDTIQAAEKFRSKWHRQSSLMAPIRDQLD